jgi:hypothetical protein
MYIRTCISHPDQRCLRNSYSVWHLHLYVGQPNSELCIYLNNDEKRDKLLCMYIRAFHILTIDV